MWYSWRRLTLIIQYFSCFWHYLQEGACMDGRTQSAWDGFLAFSNIHMECRGTLPPWSSFRKLEMLDLTSNSIEGSLPPGLRRPEEAELPAAVSKSAARVRL